MTQFERIKEEFAKLTVEEYLKKFGSCNDCNYEKGKSKECYYQTCKKFMFEFLNSEVAE